MYASAAETQATAIKVVTQQGEFVVAVKYEVFPPNIIRTLLFNYWDDGKGMSEETREKIFEPFFTTLRGQGGTGLGLHIVYNIVTQTFKGEIQCESGLGKGTRFYMVLEP